MLFYLKNNTFLTSEFFIKFGKFSKYLKLKYIMKS